MRILFCAALFVCFIAAIYCQVEVPEAWTCTASHYSEKARGFSTFSCDCGCGVYDPDCDAPAITGAHSDRVSTIYCKADREDERSRGRTVCQKSTATCTTVPFDWACEPRYWNEESTGSAGSLVSGPACHCGCGAYDPDCSSSSNYPQFCETNSKNPILSVPPANNPGYGGEFCSPVTATCVDVPKGWWCPARYYNEWELSGDPSSASCHCGCGLYDPDCNYNPQQKDLPLYCSPENAANGIDSSQDSVCQAKSGKCTAVPFGWSCPKRWYAESITFSPGLDGTYDCDCGCGIYDPDCDLSAGYSPDGDAANTGRKFIGEVPLFCSATDTVASANKACAKNTLSCEDVPTGWICPERWYNEDETGSTGPDNTADCDCGCGVYDPDCGDSDNELYCASADPTNQPDESGDNYCGANAVIFPDGDVQIQSICKDGSSATTTVVSLVFVAFIAIISLLF